MILLRSLTKTLLRPATLLIQNCLSSQTPSKTSLFTPNTFSFSSLLKDPSDWQKTVAFCFKLFELKNKKFSEVVPYTRLQLKELSCEQIKFLEEKSHSLPKQIKFGNQNENLLTFILKLEQFRRNYMRYSDFLRYCLYDHINGYFNKSNENPESKPGYNGSVRVGAICFDGTITTAIGKGAGSHHGGVMFWIRFRYANGVLVEIYLEKPNTQLQKEKCLGY